MSDFTCCSFLYFHLILECDDLRIHDLTFRTEAEVTDQASGMRVFPLPQQGGDLLVASADTVAVFSTNRCGSSENFLQFLLQHKSGNITQLVQVYVLTINSQCGCKLKPSRANAYPLCQIYKHAIYYTYIPTVNDHIHRLDISVSG